MNSDSHTFDMGGSFAASDLACRRGERLLFSHLNISVSKGELVELRGPNGSGKSTLLRILAGLRTPDAGSVSVGTIVVGAQDDHGQWVHYLGHELALKPFFSVSENVALTAAMLGGGEKRAIKKALARLDLSGLADLPVRFLSQGQRRRTALARLLTVDRPIWLLDEPNVGLDAHSRDILSDVMSSHKASGGMIIAATHVPLGLEADKILTLGALT